MNEDIECNEKLRSIYREMASSGTSIMLIRSSDNGLHAEILTKDQVEEKPK